MPASSTHRSTVHGQVVTDSCCQGGQDVKTAAACNIAGPAALVNRLPATTYPEPKRFPSLVKRMNPAAFEARRVAGELRRGRGLPAAQFRPENTPASGALPKQGLCKPL